MLGILLYLRICRIIFISIQPLFFVNRLLLFLLGLHNYFLRNDVPPYPTQEVPNIINQTLVLLTHTHG